MNNIKYFYYYFFPPFICKYKSSFSQLANLQTLFLPQNTDTYRMFTPIGANGKLLTLNFHIGTGAATNSTNN